MRKLIVLSLSAVLCLLLAACGNGGSESAGTAANTSGNADADYFEWDPLYETQIIGYTEEGLKQTTLVIPENCTMVLGLGDNPTVVHIQFENPDTQIHSNAFRNCTALQQVDLPGNLTEIADDVFCGCSSLESITIPEGVTSIGDWAFYKCTALTSFCFPDSVTEIGEKAFYRCSALTSVEFGNGLQAIDEAAFEFCVGLTTVKLPEGLLTLETEAFAYCDALESIYIPASVEAAANSCIAQTHTVAVYVVEGSYMDSQLGDLMGASYYEKYYQ